MHLGLGSIHDDEYTDDTHQCVTNDNTVTRLFLKYFMFTEKYLSQISLHARASVAQGRNGMFSKQSA